MIKQIKNETVTKKIRINTATSKSYLPAKNSFVTVKVVEVLNRHARILVNGKVFKTLFPVKSKNGEEFIGKVLNREPFTISIDDFDFLLDTKTKGFKNLLVKFGITEMSKHINLLEHLIKEKKPLEKTKLKKLLSFYDSQNESLTNDQIAVIVNLIWEQDNTTFESFKKQFKSMFDVSFEELSNQIFNCISFLYNRPLQDSILMEIKDVFVMNMNKYVELSDFKVLRDKSKQFETLIEKIQHHSLVSIPGEHALVLNQLMKLMVKYVLQKAVLAQVGVKPEFVIIKDDSNLELFVYRFIEGQHDESEALVAIETKKITKEHVPAIIYSTLMQSTLQSRMRLYSEQEINFGEVRKIRSLLKEKMNVDSSFVVDSEEDEDCFIYQIPKLIV